MKDIKNFFKTQYEELRGYLLQHPFQIVLAVTIANILYNLLPFDANVNLMIAVFILLLIENNFNEKILLLVINVMLVGAVFISFTEYSYLSSTLAVLTIELAIILIIVSVIKNLVGNVMNLFIKKEDKKPSTTFVETNHNPLPITQPYYPNNVIYSDEFIASEEVGVLHDAERILEP